MKTKVIPILTGTAQAFLIVQDGQFGLVDSGNRNTEKQVVKAITSRGLKMEDLRFIFLTHTHFDHAGNAASLKKMSDAPIIVHQSEADYLRKGFHPIPKGTSALYKFIVYLGRKLANETFSAFDATQPDVLFESRLSLQSFGFDAEILHTPGHTSGSSVLIADRKAFVGDTVFNIMGIKYPLFANDEVQLMKSWQILLNLDVDLYYPAHGKRIKKADLQKAFGKY
jgi:glyoxylase-like metal-dependent hydrolase (beta-lactamase superfamily II)